MRWKRTRQSHRERQDPEQRATKQADLDMLEFAAASGEIDLYYLDEAGFSQWSATGYSYFFVGEQKRMEQTKRRGRRVSILGLWQPLKCFTYGLSIGGFDSKSYIKMMDEQAKQANQAFQQAGRIRVIAEDNGPIHTSAAVQAKQPEWEAQGLYIFFFAKYCSEMNPIELEWQHLKKDEIAGRMFEDELDLAYAVMDGVDARAKAHGHTVERFRFRAEDT